MTSKILATAHFFLINRILTDELLVGQKTKDCHSLHSRANPRFKER